MNSMYNNDNKTLNTTTTYICGSKYNLYFN